MSSESWLFFFGAVSSVTGLIQAIPTILLLMTGKNVLDGEKKKKNSKAASQVDKQAKRVIVVMATALTLSLVLSGIGLWKSYQPLSNETADFMRSWGAFGSNGEPWPKPNAAPLLIVIADGRGLQPYTHSHRLGAVAFHAIPPQDYMDNHNLQKSELHDIANDDEIQILIPAGEKFVSEFSAGMRGTNYSVLLVPNGVNMSDFSTLRQAVAMGVILGKHHSGPP